MKEQYTSYKEIQIGKTLYLVEEHFAPKGKTLDEAIIQIVLYRIKQAA